MSLDAFTRRLLNNLTRAGACWLCIFVSSVFSFGQGTHAIVSGKHTDELIAYQSLLKAYESGEHSRVVSQVQSMSIASPPSAIELQSVYLAAESLFASGQFADAERFLAFWNSQKALVPSETLDKLAPYVQFRLSQTHFQLNRTAEAAAGLKNLLADPIAKPLLAAANLQLAWIEIDDISSTAQAREHCDQCIELTEPGTIENLSAQLLDALLTYRSKNLNEAVEKLEQVCAEAGMISGSDAIQYKATLLLLQACNDSQATEKAEIYVNHLNRLTPTSSSIKQLANFQIARHELITGLQFEAAKRLRSVAESSDNNALQIQSLTLLIRLPDYMASVDERIDWTQKLLSFDEVHDELHTEAIVRSARALAMTDRYEEAIAMLTDLIAADDIGVKWRLASKTLLAETLFQREQLDQAQVLFKEISSSQIDVMTTETKGLAILRQGEIAALQNRWNDSDSNVQLLLSEKDLSEFVSSHQAAVFYLQGRIDVSQARFDDARQKLNLAISQSKAHQSEIAARAAWLVGETYFLQKMYPAARKNYEVVLSYPEQPQWCALAKLQAGKCCELLGEWDSATSNYRELLSNYPESIYCKQAEERLLSAAKMSDARLTAREPKSDQR